VKTVLKIKILKRIKKTKIKEITIIQKAVITTVIGKKTNPQIQ